VKRITGALVCLALVGVLAAGTLAACGSGGSGLPSDAVAKVGSVTVTKDQFAELLDQARATFTSNGKDFPKEGSPQFNEFKARIVSYLVSNAILQQVAGKYGVSVSDAEVSAQVAKMQQAYGGAAAFQKMIAQQGMTQDLLKRTLRAQLLLQKMQALVVKGIAVGDKQVKQYWEAHKAELEKKAATATFAKAQASIRALLLSAVQSKQWAAWVDQRSKELGLKFAPGYDPHTLLPSASPSATAP
jgi:hypothetical protein